MRIAIGVEYDGSSFAGWQSQTHGNTVQDVLERALSHVADNRIRTACAGRTDAGVHALAQVVHFDAPTRRPLPSWCGTRCASTTSGGSVPGRIRW